MSGCVRQLYARQGLSNGTSVLLLVRGLACVHRELVPAHHTAHALSARLAGICVDDRMDGWPGLDRMWRDLLGLSRSAHLTGAEPAARSLRRKHFVVLEHNALGLALLLIAFFDFLVGTFTPAERAASGA